MGQYFSLAILINNIYYLSDISMCIFDFAYGYLLGDRSGTSCSYCSPTFGAIPFIWYHERKSGMTLFVDLVISFHQLFVNTVDQSAVLERC